VRYREHVITNSYGELFQHNPTKKANVEATIQASASTPADATSAVIIVGWHTSKSDRRNHITVDYFDVDSAFISRLHVV